ncbi:MAG: aminotransferase class V-fold PLP-dependent enzyme, partial [Chloroflexota bacterium]|nr:aminotransferase class V-fold PLP-dependent enzyme [Chloroflexota bacterium]
ACFPVFRNTIWMHTSSCGPMLGAVRDEIIHYYTLTAEVGDNVPPNSEERMASYRALRPAIAKFMNAQPEEIAYNYGVASGISTIAWGLDWKEGDEIILTDKEYPTNVLPWVVLRERFGVVIKTIPLVEDKDVILRELKKAITPRTRLLTFGHVDSPEGFMAPAKEMCAVAREHGILTQIDGAQAIGRFPVDMQDIGCDSYNILPFKYLFGPRGIGALYVRKERLPEIATSWTGSGGQIRGQWGAEKATFHQTAQKYEFGNSRLSILYAAWTKSFDFFAEHVDLVEARKKILTLAEELARELGKIPKAQVYAPKIPDFSAGQVNLRIEGVKNYDLLEIMRKGWGIFPCRQWTNEDWTRFPVAVFNTEEDILQVIKAATAIAKGA